MPDFTDSRETEAVTFDSLLLARQLIKCSELRAENARLKEDVKEAERAKCRILNAWDQALVDHRKDVTALKTANATIYGIAQEFDGHRTRSLNPLAQVREMLQRMSRAERELREIKHELDKIYPCKSTAYASKVQILGGMLTSHKASVTKAHEVLDELVGPDPRRRSTIDRLRNQVGPLLEERESLERTYLLMVKQSEEDDDEIKLWQRRCCILVDEILCGCGDSYIRGDFVVTRDFMRGLVTVEFPGEDDPVRLDFIDRTAWLWD